MNLVKKISQIFSLLLFVILLSSCEDRCFETDEFSSYFISVDSYPQNDGIVDVSITNDHANWHETTLKSNGDEFVIKITGTWTPWNGRANGGMTDNQLNALDECDLCAVKADDSSANCICLYGENPQAEIGKECRKKSSLGTYADENNPNLCSCTTDPSQGDPYGENIKYRLLNYYEKDGTIKIADHQNRCRFVNGAGLYIGLFGPSGLVSPKRIYHLYSDEMGCSITKNSNGQCLDSSGEDKSYAIFRSKNKRIFMRDDGAGNDGNDTNTSDDIYHTSNEVIKFKLYDEEYENNYGKYRLEIQKGVGDGSNRNQVGLLEFMVRLVEDIVLGDLNGNNERVGGMVEFMYKSIVQDSFFINFVQISLILYVAIYGMATLSGVAEISKKELTNRVLKIGLILLFTSADSWKIYNDIVVGFFYDGMNYLISFFMSLSDQAVDSAQILDASLGRAAVDNGVMISSATRFTYIDNMIIMLMSEAVAAKIFSLALSTPFGILYVFVIYALVAIFIIVMSYAAMLYIINVLKIIFGLSLGPIFILFTLFSETSQMFKSWITFLAGRSLEIIMLFFVLFNFVVILNEAFFEMLSYRACLEHLDLVLFKLPYLHAYVGDRSMSEWMLMFFKILGLTYMTYVVMEKVGDVAGSLISVGGVASGGSGGSSFGLAGKMMGGVAGIAGSVAGKAALAGAYAGLGVAKAGAVAMRQSGISSAASSGAKSIAEKSGLASVGRAISDRVPGGASLKNPREFARDQKYKAMIKKAEAIADKEGLKGSARDAKVRQEALNIFQNSVNKGGNSLVTKSEPHTANMLGMNLDNFAKTLNHQLTEKPLREAIKKEAERVKNSKDPADIKFGKDMKDHLNNFASDWAKKNLSTGHEDVARMMQKKDASEMSKFERTLHQAVNNGSELKAEQAAKGLKDSPEQQAKYMQHLQDKENKQKADSLKLKEDREKRFDAKIGGVNLLAPARMTANLAGDIARGVKSVGTESSRPDLARKNFERNLQNQENRSGNWLSYGASKLNILNRNNATDAMASGIFGKGDRDKNLSKMDEKRKDIVRDNLRKNPLNDKTSKIDKTNSLGEAIEDKFKGQKHLAEEKAKQDEDRRNRQVMQNTLREDATKDLKWSMFKDGISSNGSFEDRLKGSIGDKGDAKTPFEQASRLEFARSNLGLGGDNIEKHLSEKLNEKIDSDLKDISQRMQDSAKNGDMNEFDKAKKELEDVNNARASLFSDDKEGKYSQFLQDELDKKAKEIEDRISKADKEDIASKEVDKNQNDIASKEDLENKMDLASKEQKDKKASEEQLKQEEAEKAKKVQDENVDRGIYGNDREALDKLEKMQEEVLKLESQAKEQAEANRIKEEERLLREQEIKEMQDSLKTMDMVNSRFEKLNKELQEATDEAKKLEISRQLENLKAVQESLSAIESLSNYKKSANNKVKDLFKDKIDEKDDFYSITGIDKNCTDSEFNKARKVALLKHHADKNLDNKEQAYEIVAEINELYSKASAQREKDAQESSKNDAEIQDTQKQEPVSQAPDFGKESSSDLEKGLKH